jgi:hypothetical protein
VRENSSPLTPEFLFLIQYFIRNLTEQSIGDDTDFMRVKHRFFERKLPKEISTEKGVWAKSRARERTSATALSSPLCRGGRVIPLWPRIADMKCRGVPDPGGFLAETLPYVFGRLPRTRTLPHNSEG